MAKTFGCTVREVQNRVNAREFAEWMAFNELEPIDRDMRGDYRNAILCQLVASVYRRKGAARPKVQWFIPNFEKRFVRQPVADMAAVFSHFAKIHNQQIDKRRKERMK